MKTQKPEIHEQTINSIFNIDHKYSNLLGNIIKFLTDEQELYIINKKFNKAYLLFVDSLKFNDAGSIYAFNLWWSYFSTIKKDCPKPNFKQIKINFNSTTNVLYFPDYSRNSLHFPKGLNIEKLIFQDISFMSINQFSIINLPSTIKSITNYYGGFALPPNIEELSSYTIINLDNLLKLRKLEILQDSFNRALVQRLSIAEYDLSNCISIQYLIINKLFDNLLDTQLRIILPSNLVSLEIGQCIGGNINNLPNTLKSIKLLNRYTPSLRNLHEGLIQLIYEYDDYNFSSNNLNKYANDYLCEIIIPTTLKYLKLPYCKSYVRVRNNEKSDLTILDADQSQFYHDNPELIDNLHKIETVRIQIETLPLYGFYQNLSKLIINSGTFNENIDFSSLNKMKEIRLKLWKFNSNLVLPPFVEKVFLYFDYFFNKPFIVPDSVNTFMLMRDINSFDNENDDEYIEWEDNKSKFKLTNLPNSIETLILSGIRNIDFPTKLKNLYIFHDDWDNEFDFSKLPDSLETIYFEFCNDLRYKTNVKIVSRIDNSMEFINSIMPEINFV